MLTFFMKGGLVDDVLISEVWGRRIYNLLWNSERSCITKSLRRHRNTCLPIICKLSTAYSTSSTKAFHVNELLLDCYWTVIGLLLDYCWTIVELTVRVPFDSGIIDKGETRRHVTRRRRERLIYLISTGYNDLMEFLLTYWRLWIETLYIDVILFNGK